MANKLNVVKPVAAVVGVAFVSSLAVTSTAMADDNPFSTTDLEDGYQLAGDKGEEGKCGEGKCGGDNADKGAEGSCGEKDEDSCREKGEEGHCGGDKGAEGSCGGDKGAEGSCGGDKGEEGKCGGSA